VSGNLGIGASSLKNTAAGRTVLDINGSSTSWINLDANNTSIAYIGANSTNGFMNTDGAAYYLTLGTNGNEVMRVTGSYVGIGTTNPSVSLDVASSARFNSAGNWMQFETNVLTSLNSDGAHIRSVISTAANPTYTFKGDTDTGMFSETANTLAFTTSGSEKMRITSTGSVGIGTTNPTYKLDIHNGADFDIRLRDTSLGGTVGILFESANDFSGTSQSYIKGVGASNSGVSYLIFGTANTSGAVTGSERMRITSNGFTKMSNNGTYPYSGTDVHEIASSISDNTLIIHNSSAVPSGIFTYYVQAPNGNSNYFYNAYDGNIATKRFAVRSNGGIENYQANDVNLSDERTKKDITLLDSYWNKFKAIEVVKFKYKDQTHDDFNIGLIAQQVEEIAPEFVDTDGWDNGKPKIEGQEETVSTEEPMKSIYTADLYHATIKVLQEAMAKIETLETTINALTTRITALEN
jgi:hypothetical protein